MSSAPGYDIDDTIGGDEDAEAFANGSAYFGCAEALGGVLGVAEIGEKFVGGGGDGSCTATFIGGVDSKTIMNYADSLNSLTKEKLVDSILGVFSELNIKTSGSTNEEKLQSLAKTLRTKEFKEGSNFDVVVKKISQAINSHFQSEVVPASSNSLSNKQRIDLIAQFMRSLSHGVHSEFLSLYNDFADVLKTGHMIKNALKLTRDGYTETIEKSTDTYLSTALLQKKELWDLLLNELERFLKMLGELTSVSLTPTDESLANLIKYDENNKLVFLPTYGEKSTADSIQNKISSMLVNTGTTGALVEAIQKCLKTIGLTMSQYIKGTEGKLYSAVLEKMTKESLSDDDAIHLLECVKFLSGNYYKIKDIEKKFEEMSNSKQGGGYRSPFGGSDEDDGMLPRPLRVKGRAEYAGGDDDDRNLTATGKRVKVLRAEKQLLVNAFQKQAFGLFKQIISSVESIARAVGRDIQLSPALEDFRQQLMRVGTDFIGKKHIWNVLIGVNARDAWSMSAKSDVVSDLKMLSDSIDAMLPSLGEGAGSSFKALRESVRAFLALIDQYSASVTAKFGGVDLKSLGKNYASQLRTAATGLAGDAARGVTAAAGDAARSLAVVGHEAASRASVAATEAIGDMSDAIKGGLISGGFESDWATDNFADSVSDAGAVGGAGIWDIAPRDTLLTSTTSSNFYKAVAELDARVSAKQIEQGLKNAGKDMELYGTKYNMLVTNSLKELFIKAENRFNNMRDKLNEAIAAASDTVQAPLITGVLVAGPVPTLSEWKKELKIAGEFLALQHESRKRFWDTVSHLDQYMRFFTDSVLKNPSAVHLAIESLNDIHMFNDWYRAETGNNLIKIFESFPSNIGNEGNANNDFINALPIEDNGHYYQRVYSSSQVNLNRYPGNPYIVTYPTKGMSARKQTKTMLSGFGVLKNIVSVFVGLGAKFGGDDARISGLMSPTQMYTNLIDYVQASAFAQGWAWTVTENKKADGGQSTTIGYGSGHYSCLVLNKYTLKGLAAGRCGPDAVAVIGDVWEDAGAIIGPNPAGAANNADRGTPTSYQTNTDNYFKVGTTAINFNQEEAANFTAIDNANKTAWYIRKHWGIWMRSINPLLKTIDTFDFQREDEYFVLMLKAMSAKIFTVAGLYDMFTRPTDLDTRRISLRMVLGGSSESVAVEEGAVELYLRLPLLLQFYRTLFRMSEDKLTDGFRTYPEYPTNDKDLKIAMMPDTDGMFGGLIRLIFRKNRLVDQTVYSNEDIVEVVREVNSIYNKMKISHPKDTVAAVISELVNEVNRRYGVVSKDDTAKYERESTLGTYSRGYNDTTDNAFVDEFALLPGEEASEGLPYIPSEARQAMGMSMTGSDSTPLQRGISRDHNKLVKTFRCMLDGLIDSSKTDDHKSFRVAIKQAQLKLRSEQRSNERIQIVGSLMRGLDITTRADTMKYLMFHETVVAGLNTLSALHTLLVRFQRTIIALDIDKLAEYVLDRLMMANGVAINQMNIRSHVRGRIGQAAGMLTDNNDPVAAIGNLPDDFIDLIDNVIIANTFLAANVSNATANEEDNIANGYLMLGAEIPMFAPINAQRGATAADFNIAKQNYIKSSSNIHMVDSGVNAADANVDRAAIPRSIYGLIVDHDLAHLKRTLIAGKPLRAESGNAVALADTGVNDFNDLQLFIRLLFDHEFVMKTLIETLYSLSNDMGGLVEIKLTDNINISTGGLQAQIGELFNSIESMLGFFRPYIDKTTIERYTDKRYAGSFYWLYEQLNEKLFRGREPRDASGDDQALAGYISIDQCSRRVRAIYTTLTKETNLDGRVFDGVNTIDVARANPHKLKISYDKVFAELIFYNAIRSQSGLAISTKCGAPSLERQGVHPGATYAATGLLQVADYQHNTYDQLHVSCQGSQRTLDTRFICRFANLYSWDNEFNNNRSALFAFNQLIAKFIYSFYDNASRVMYSALINPFVNGAFNKPVFDFKYTYPDTVPLIYTKEKAPESLVLPNTYALDSDLDGTELPKADVFSNILQLMIKIGCPGYLTKDKRAKLFDASINLYTDTDNIVISHSDGFTAVSPIDVGGATGVIAVAPQTPQIVSFVALAALARVIEMICPAGTPITMAGNPIVLSLLILINNGGFVAGNVDTAAHVQAAARAAAVAANTELAMMKVALAIQVDLARAPSASTIYERLIRLTRGEREILLRMDITATGLTFVILDILHAAAAAAAAPRILLLQQSLKNYLGAPDGPRAYLYGNYFSAFPAIVRRAPFKKDSGQNDRDIKYKCDVISKMSALSHALRIGIIRQSLTLALRAGAVVAATEPPDFQNTIVYWRFLAARDAATNDYDVGAQTTAMEMFATGITNIVGRIIGRTPTTYYQQSPSPGGFTIPWDEIPIARKDLAIDEHVGAVAFDVGYLFMPRSDPDPDFPLDANAIDRAEVASRNPGAPLTFAQISNFGERFDPDGDHVLFTSLAEILRNIVSNKSIAGNIPSAIVENISDVSGFMKEKYKAHLPVFRNLFKELSGKCEFLTQWLNHPKLYAERNFGGFRAPTYNPWPYTLIDPAGTSDTVKQRFSAILASIGRGCASFSSACDDVMRQLADEPKYMETCANMIKDYKAQHGVDPLILLSSSLRFMADTSDTFLPIHDLGDDQFKYMYGTRGLFGSLSGVPSLSLFGGFSATVDHHNALSDHPIDKSKLESFVKVYVKLLRFIYQQRVLKGSLTPFISTSTWHINLPRGVVAPATDLSRIVPYSGMFVRAPLVAVAISPVSSTARNVAAANPAFNAVSQDGMNPKNRSDVSMIGIDVLYNNPGIANGTAMWLTKIPRPVYHLDTPLADAIRLIETPQRDEYIKKIHKYMTGLQTENQDSMMLRNIIDLNLIPINVNAMMRDIPFISLYNYAYTWDRLIVEHHYGVGGRNTAKIIGDLCNGDNGSFKPLSAKDMLVKLLIDPYYNVHGVVNADDRTRVLGLVRGVFDGVADSGVLGRPKFLSDVIDTVVFGEVYAGAGKYNEVGPAASTAMRSRSALTTVDKVVRLFKTALTSVQALFVGIIDSASLNKINESICVYVKNNYDIFPNDIPDAAAAALAADLTLRLHKLLFTKIFNNIVLSANSHAPVVNPGAKVWSDVFCRTLGAEPDRADEVALAFMYAFATVYFASRVKTYVNMDAATLHGAMDLLTTDCVVILKAVAATALGDIARVASSMGNINFGTAAVVLNINSDTVHLLWRSNIAAVVKDVIPAQAVLFAYAGLALPALADSHAPKALHYLDEVGTDSVPVDSGDRWQPDNDNVVDSAQVKSVDVSAISDRLATIGACRFDTVLIRNLMFMTLLQRATQSKLRADFGGAGVRRFDGPVVSAPQFIAQPRATNLYGNQGAKDRAYKPSDGW